MLFERIISEGLAHYSYLIGEGVGALVIDPRRDCAVYEEVASKHGYRIEHILETHRNEDYVIGSVELASRTGAEIWHADPQLAYKYGQSVKDGQTWKIGRFKIQAIHSPGHTPGSMSYLLFDRGGEPWVIFTGDALFAGDVGRVDLPGVERTEEMAGLLFDTLFNKLLPLGDDVIVCPGHGAGSVCGASIADKPWTTIGLEKRLNPKLQFTDRDEFVLQTAQILERPPYFRQMEILNIEGAPLLGALPVPIPLSPGDFDDAIEGLHVLDTRMELGFSTAHVPGALSIWLEGLPGFAGWFLHHERPIFLVNETDDSTLAVRYLVRLGFDELAGVLSGGMLAWHTAGMRSASVETVTVHELCRLLDRGEKVTILDVRGEEEIDSAGRIAGAVHIHITQLPYSLDEVPKKERVFIFCGSGLRSMIAASILKMEGLAEPVVILGGLSGWSSTVCPVQIREE
ncbi:MAG: MBL fold metallo-hydrolase [bacterium]|nr:MAG: MBL fold metallo-hydrolase [bacterium]